MRALLSLYCAKGKDFDQFVLKNEMKELEFNKFFAHEVFSQLEVWRSAIPDDIVEDEMKGLWNTNGRLHLIPLLLLFATKKVSVIYLFKNSCANYFLCSVHGNHSTSSLRTPVSSCASVPFASPESQQSETTTITDNCRGIDEDFIE